MGLGSSLNVMRAGVVWRTVGSQSAGQTLLRAVSGDDEQNRMLAGMSLVKAGDRSVDLIDQAYQSGEATPQMIQLLPSMDSLRCRELLTDVGTDEGSLGKAAIDGLQRLERMDALLDEDNT